MEKMSVSVSAKIKFEQLCQVLEDIQKTARQSRKPQSKTRAKIKLQKFIEECRNVASDLKKCADADTSLYPILRLLLPRLEREKGPHNLKEKSLANIYIHVFCFNKKAQDAQKLMNYTCPVSGKFASTDFADRVYGILRNQMLRDDTGLTVEEINKFLDDISKKSSQTGAKHDLFTALLRKITAFQLKWLTRFILKDLKLGLDTTTILQAYHEDASTLFNVTSDLRKIVDTLHDRKVRHQEDIQLFSHFKPMLLERCAIEAVRKLFKNKEQYFVQTKYDGERSQIHMKDGLFKYYSRRGFDITNNPSYGGTASTGGFLTQKLSRLLNKDCQSIILDGELMGWYKPGKRFCTKGDNFDVKKLTSASSLQPCFVAYDVVLYNDKLLTNLPYTHRLNILKDAFVEEEGCLIRCRSMEVTDSEKVLHVFNKSIEDNEEGIVLKRCDVAYKPNVRERSGCYKIKADFSANLVQDLDFIIVGGSYGGGSYTGLVRSFLMSVADVSKGRGEEPSKFFTVSFVSSGITREKLQDLNKKLQTHWITACPPNVIAPKTNLPDVWINPEHSLILTVRATKIIPSSTYPTDYTLQFPRVVDVREDKPWYNTCTITEFSSLIKSTRIEQKLTKRIATIDDISEGEIPETRKIPKSHLSRLQKQYYGTEAIKQEHSVIPISRLLDGKEICVINGTDDNEKKYIEEILLQHRAKLVQTPGKDTYCVIIGNTKTAKANNIIQSSKYDVVTVNWFYRVLEEDFTALNDFVPWELLSMRESTRTRMFGIYDKYFDSFTMDANEESIKRSLERAGEEEENATGDDDFCSIDKELFENGVSPFALFRNIVGYFDNPNDDMKLKFLFMTGTIKEVIDDTVTYVFLERADVTSINNYKIISESREQPMEIIYSKWIDDCCSERNLFPTQVYTVG